MKIIFSIAVIAFALSANSIVYAESDGKSSVEKSISIDPSKTLAITARNSDVEILVWDKNELKISGEISYGEGSNEDINKLVNAFKNIDVKTSNNSTDLNLNHFIKSSTINGKKHTIVLTTGDEINIKDNKVNTSYKVWIPQNINLNVKQNYGSITTADMNGNLNLTLFSTKFNIGNYGSSGQFDMKYCKGSMANGGNTKLLLFSSEFASINQLKDVSIESKYSKFNVANAKNVTIMSFSDKFLFEQADNITFNAKYSELRTNSNIKSSTLDIYSSKVFAKDFEEIKFSAKYSELNAKDINDLTIHSSFSNKFNIGTVSSLQCTESKYDQINIAKLTEKANIKKAYSTKIKIASASESLKHFGGNFEYGSVYIKLEQPNSLNLIYRSKYGKVNVPKNWNFSTKTNNKKNNSTIEFEGSTADNAKTTIEFTSVSTNVTIE